MRKVLNFVKGRRDDKKGHGSSGSSIGPFSDLPSPVDQPTPTDDHCTGLEQKYGYNVDLSGKDKSITKLHKAAWVGNLEKLKVNMKKIDLNVVDEFNRTALHLAAARGHANIVWFLLGNKANFNICDTEGKTPFLKAVECGHKETIQLMLERGVDINTIDYRGNSGLHIAAKHGFYEIASMLLKQGANFESSNNYGEFPLHIATVAEHKDLVELLLRYGSSVNIVDRDNRSPLMFAAKCGSMTLVQLFLEYGAQRAVMDSNDWTAEDYALMGGFHDIAAELKSPSERMVMSFNEKSVESQRCDSGLALNKRSVSDASLPPDQQEHEKEDTKITEGQNEDADNSDTWNDSQLSDSSLKQKGAGLKLTKFLPPSSDDEISEESIQSPRMQEMKDEEVQDSPRSCVIPPPCKPPRSWDLIQSGVIDDPKVMEPRRRSLLPLGSLRSRRESFNESPSTAESPSVHGDTLHVGQGDTDQKLGSQSFRKTDDKRDSLTRHHVNLSEHEENKYSPSTKCEVIEAKDNGSQLYKEKNEVCPLIGTRGDGILDEIRSSKESLKGSSSNSDWDSDDSLPLDNYPVADVTISPGDVSPLKVFRIINPSELCVPDSGDDPNDGSPYSLSAEKRSRFLTRALSIDLTDDDTEPGRSKWGHSHKAAALETHKSDTKGDNETDVNSSVSGTLGRDGTLLGYEEVWESNAHIPENNVAVTGPASVASDTNILVKEQLLEALVLSSPKFDITDKGMSSELTKHVSENYNTFEDTLVYPSPRFGKARSVAVSENDVCTESTKSRTDDGDRQNNGLKLESHSLDALEPLKFVPDTKVPRTRKHARQQSISVQSWSRSEELHEKQPTVTHIDRMMEENQRINAQLRCYDEALRDLAHVSVVRKQSSLSLPRAKEASNLTRSQSAGARNDGFLSLSFASEVGPREMAQSAIVKKQGSLSLPRTSEIPDFAMVPSLGPKKQGHSSLPCTNDFGMREMAQTAIVKRQGSLSLPRTCEIPDFASAANEEYLSLPRSNELIDEAFKEIGQSSVTMKRGSNSLPRSVDAKSISLGADPVPPPRHKKSSHRRRRAESEGETSDRYLKDTIGRSLSFVVKAQSSDVIEPAAASLKLGVENVVATKSVRSPDADEKQCVESTPGSSNSKDISVEKPIRKKRKMLLAMRGFLGQNRKSLNGSSVSELSVEGSFDDQPFMMSRDKTGSLERQVTVIERPGFSIKESDSTTLSPARLETLEKQDLRQQSTVKEHAEVLNTQPSSSLLEGVSLLEETASGGEKDDDRILPDHLQKVSPETQSEDAESGLSLSDSTPQHGYVPKGHHNVLKQHLQKATAEKGRLEETAAELGDKAEQLKYELAEAHEAARSRDEVIALLEDQLNNLETLYTKSLEESQRYKLRLGNLEQELQHLKELCAKHKNENSELTEIIKLKEMEKINLDKSTAKTEEKRLQAKSGEKECEQKQQALETHVNYLETENVKLKEDVYKLETKNEDLRHKLNAVVARNQLLFQEKSAICTRNSVDMEILQDLSEQWRQLCETCVEKLQLLSSCKPSVDSEAHTRHTEREYFRDEVQQVIQRIEEAKEKIYSVLYNKIQEDVLNAVELLIAEYSKVESLLLKHNEQHESLVSKLLEDLSCPCSKQFSHGESSMETSTAYTAVKQLEELTTLTSELKEHCQQLQQRMEYIIMKSETLKLSSFTCSAEASVTQEELRKENVLLRNEETQLLGDNAKELWHELKDENTLLKEQISILLARVQQEEKREVRMKSDHKNGIPAENTEPNKEQVEKNVGCCDKGIVTDVTMLTFGQNVGLNEANKLERAASKDFLEQEVMAGPMMWKQSSDHAQELLLELRSENARLQRQLDCIMQHIKHKEDMISKETMTASIQSSDELIMENLKLKQQITFLLENIKENNVREQEMMPECLAYELPEQFRVLLSRLKIENTKLRGQLQLFELHLKDREAVEDRQTMTDPLEWKQGQKCEDENTTLKADILLPENKIRPCNKELNDTETDFGAVLGENEVEGATCCASRLCEATSKGNCSSEACTVDLNVQNTSEKKLTDHKEVVVQEMLAENRELKGQLASVRLELEKFHINRMVHEVQSLKTNMHTVQTMTDPDIELVHVSMENAALHAQLQELTGEYKNKSEDLERTLVLLRETREASSFLLKEARDANAHENTLLKQEFEEMKQKLKNQEQEMYDSRAGATREQQPTKIAELCNLLDYLRKENIDLQAQLKKLLAEKEHKEEDEYLCHNLQQTQETSKDQSVDNCGYRALTNGNHDSLTLLVSMGYPVSSEEAHRRELGGIKSSNIEIMDMTMPFQNGSASTVTNMPVANQDEPKFSIKTEDKCTSEQSFGNISLLNKAKQSPSNAESKSQSPVNPNKKKQELQDAALTKLQISKYAGGSVQLTGIGSKQDETGCTVFINNLQNHCVVSHGILESDDVPSRQTQEDYVPKVQPALSQGFGVTLKHQQIDKDNSSCSSEVMLDMVCCQNQMLCGLSSENTNSDLGSLNKEPVMRANFRSYRDAATNTASLIQSHELLQRDLQLEKDKCRKYQQNVKKLKSDVQFLKNKLGESIKQGKIESNLALKQNNTNNNSFLTGMQSPSHYDTNMAEFQRQVADLEHNVREEASVRFALEVQVNKMRCELQEKLQVERELDVLRNRLEKDFVSRNELEQLRNSYEVALSRAKYEAEVAARDDLNKKLCQINTFIEKQVQEQTHLSQLRNTTEAHMKQDFQETRLKLLSELAKVQASLQAKGEEEKELREKCGKLTRECEKKHEIRRKKLIEKSYNVNLAPSSNLKEKELNSKGCMLDMKSPIHRSSPVQPVINSVSSPAVAMTSNIADAWQTEHPFSHILRRELERSIRKHTRTDSLTEHPSTSSPQKASEEHLELLKKKYFLH